MNRAATAAPDHLVVSPHPDDAVWSLGGLIARWCGSGRTVTVLTVFDGEAAEVPPGDWRRIASPARRRREDRAGLALVGAARASAGLPEAALRSTGPAPRYTSPLRLFGGPHADDRALAGRIAKAVAALLGPCTYLCAPLGAGGHVDHVLVRTAVESDTRLRARATWYEDFPYRLRPGHHAGLSPVHERVDMDRWVAAAGCYASQARAMFGGPAALERALRQRAAGHGDAGGVPYAVRLWR